MQITEITIRPCNDGWVRGYVDIVFDNCLQVAGIKVIKGPTGLFISFPSRKHRDGGHRQLAFPANAQTRMIIQQAVLSKYEKIAGESEPTWNARTAAERLSVIEQLKNDGLITEEEYHSKRKENLEELQLSITPP